MTTKPMRDSSPPKRLCARNSLPVRFRVTSTMAGRRRRPRPGRVRRRRDGNHRRRPTMTILQTMKPRIAQPRNGNLRPQGLQRKRRRRRTPLPTLADGKRRKRRTLVPKWSVTSKAGETRRWSRSFGRVRRADRRGLKGTKARRERRNDPRRVRQPHRRAHDANERHPSPQLPRQQVPAPQLRVKMTRMSR